MEKFYTSKTFLKMAGGMMHTPHPTSLAISYRIHQKSLALLQNRLQYKRPEEFRRPYLSEASNQPRIINLFTATL